MHDEGIKEKQVRLNQYTAKLDKARHAVESGTVRIEAARHAVDTAVRNRQEADGKVNKAKNQLSEIRALVEK